MPRGTRWQKRMEKRGLLQSQAKQDKEDKSTQDNGTEVQVEGNKVSEPVEVKVNEEHGDEQELPKGLVEGENGWFTASDGEKVRGEKKAIEYQTKLNEQTEGDY